MTATRAAPAPRRRPGGAGDDPATRKRLIDAAIRTILDKGFYRASSNAIAEAAGLSWGVIQYYFGSRESLMLGVLEEGGRRLTEELSRADITSTTISERLEQYFTILEGYYGSDDYLAFIQVMLNLSRDPATSEQARTTMTDNARAVDAELKRLTNKLFAGTGIKRSSLRGFPFHILRGLALSEVMLRALPYDTEAMAKDIPVQRRLLARALSLLLEEEGAKASERSRR
jgi:AcrR family transcriptional regulator